MSQERPNEHKEPSHVSWGRECMHPSHASLPLVFVGDCEVLFSARRSTGHLDFSTDVSNCECVKIMREKRK